MNPSHRTLGLDIATHTGYALAVGGKCVKSGVRDFSIKSYQHKGDIGISFFNFLVREIGAVDEIFYEKLTFGGGFRDKKSGKWVNSTNDGRELQHGLMMVMQMYAAGYGIHPEGIHPGTLKKDFTGHGHAEKGDMCRMAHYIGWQGGVAGTALMHDEADAIAILYTQLKARHNIIMHF